ncbi:hypothetical protein PV797_09465 [Clostridiaceae bacterium M8S5]|nr:hypothetical protein PV797_09465 [Clostridiaceae bacterium M8S5]
MLNLNKDKKVKIVKLDLSLNYIEWIETKDLFIINTNFKSN